MIRKIGTGLTLLLMLAAVTTPVWADRDNSERKHDRNELRRPNLGVSHERREYSDKERKNYEDRGFRYDSRYRHNRYYPPRDYIVKTLPHVYHRVPYRGVNYYFSAGVWYIGSNLGFRVVVPPIGIVTAELPPFYTTIWVSGSPYYYADGVYYVWRPSVPGYVVVSPPDEAKVSEEADTEEDLFIYPKQGQSEEQQATDRYECYRWAADQTGFDPTEPAGGVPADQHVAKRADYQRAMKACLEGRGYSVK